MNINKSFHILVVDDEVEYQTVFSLILRENGYRVSCCSNALTAMDYIKNNEINLVLTDLKMPNIDGLELIQMVKNYDPEIDIMIATAYGSIESAVEAMKHGAIGYFVKSSDSEALLIDINRITEIRTLKKSNEILRQQASSPEIFIDTKNEEVKKVLEVCKKAADSNINVLLLGESGVGKEIFAQFIHRLSNRSDNHFIPVNCQVFSEGMIESELFGHEKGAFTGATSKRIGRFEEANYGTIFLDEIGDLPIATQGKLLRVLETWKIERVGSNKSIDLNLRLISATNKNLEEEIQKGNFREDFLYRINTLTITIPPLRQRKEDLERLISFFLEKIQREQKKKIINIEEGVRNFLMQYDYPGNIRELKNILERLVALSEGGTIRAKDLLPPLQQETQGTKQQAALTQTLRDARSEFEADYIARALKKYDSNISKTAVFLGITKRQLWNKISEYNLKN
ncbi:sigma-54-dependent transcriptional regulator [Anaerovorax sp. IOR16]|uniref:sigma-54-dependent transcriptional regulator n=1 Tax=Anaerovorax sp. IOR16 TaxID=2773458 RepID=UPI0019D2416C|nr:sigma-54 dependent transcriptional regulator [Anaerovorax sp. IOR16]